MSGARSARAASPAPALTVDDLDREELLILIKERAAFRLCPRDLWRARWEVLTARARLAFEAQRAASAAWSAALDRRNAPGVTRMERARQIEAADRAWRAYKRAGEATKRADAAADAAYAALDACP